MEALTVVKIFLLLVFCCCWFEFSSASGGSAVNNRCHIPHFVNGRAKLISRGQVITYKCYRGFTMLESVRRAICFGGQWHPSGIPVCVKEGCIDLTPPKNGFKSVSVAGALTKFGCDSGKDNS